MTLRATIELKKGGEKRSAARKTLRLTVSGQRANREATEVLIYDLSEGGMLIESAEPLRIGETIATEIPHAGLRKAIVTWSSSSFYGCRFADPLPSAAISAALLKALPAARGPITYDEQEQDLPTDFSDRLTELRESRGLSIEQLAKRLRVSRQALWYWETGQRTPRKHLLSRLAEELGVFDSDLTGATKGQREAPTSLRAWKELIASQYGVGSESVKIVIEL